MEIYYCCIIDGSCFYPEMFGVFSDIWVADGWFICLADLHLVGFFGYGRSRGF